MLKQHFQRLVLPRVAHATARGIVLLLRCGLFVSDRVYYPATLLGVREPEPPVETATPKPRIVLRVYRATVMQRYDSPMVYQTEVHILDNALQGSIFEIVRELNELASRPHQMQVEFMSSLPKEPGWVYRFTWGFDGQFEEFIRRVREVIQNQSQRTGEYIDAYFLGLEQHPFIAMGE